MFDLFAENAKLGVENKRLTQRVDQREQQLEQMIFDLSQETAEKERLKRENVRLQQKLHRMKQSIAGQEKLWLQTKVGLQSEVIRLKALLNIIRDNSTYGKFPPPMRILNSQEQEDLLRDLDRITDPNQ
jgi:hypothetical protein